MSLSTRQLRIFVLLAQTLSFRQTADLLFVTQPTLSKLLKEMEDSLGFPLFERSTRVVRLSSEGQALLATAQRITALHEQGMQEFNQRLREQTQRVAIAAMPTLAASLMPALIERLSHAKPDIKIEIFDPIASEALELLRQRRVDIALTAIGDERPADLTYQELFTEPFVLFHSPQHPVQLTHWCPQTLAHLPLISMPIGTSVRTLIEQAFHAASCAFQPLYSLRDLNTIARFVQSNCGVALLPESSLDHTAQHGLVKRHLDGAITRSVGMLMRREYLHSTRVHDVLQHLQVLGQSRQRAHTLTIADASVTLP